MLKNFSDDKAQHYLDIAGVMIIALDDEGRIELINRKGCHILGKAESELIGINWFDRFLPSEIVPEIKSVFSQLMAGEIEPVEFYENEIVNAAGQKRLIAWHNSAIRDENNNITGLLSSGEDITDRRSLETSLKDSEKKYRSLAETLPDMIYQMSLPEGKYLYVSPAAEIIFGVAPNDWYETPKLISELIHPAWDAYFKEEWQKLITTGNAATYEYQINHPTKGVRWLNQRNHISKNADGIPTMITGIVSDVTPQKELDNELLQTKEKFRNIAEYSNDWIWTIDLNARHQYSNNAVKMMLGYSVDEIYKMDVFDLFHEDDKEHVRDTVSKCIKNKTGWKNLEIRWLHKDGNYRYLESSSSPVFNESGELTGFNGIDRDITEYKFHEKNLEESIKQRTRELTQAKEEAERANMAKSQFLAIMSHEIRTPMNAILGYSELELVNKTLADKSLKNLQKIHESSQFLLNIINDILDLSKLESEKVKLENISFQLNEFIKETFSVFEQQIQAKGLSLNVNLAPDLPNCVSGDPTRLRQVITNLLSNSIKFTEQGQINFECQKHQNPNTLHFSVGDTGIGLSAVQLETVFDSFAQADASTTRVYGGTGLGTSISKRLVEAMGGEIWAESEPDKGSIFHFTCCLSFSDDCVETVQAEVKDSQVITPVKAQKGSSPGSAGILLVEDNQFNQELILQQLEISGYAADIAENGVDALNKIEKGNYRLVISDISMPIMDGYELIQQIRNQEMGTGKHLKVIAMTANVMDGENKKCLEKGFDDYCSKPLQIDLLRKKLQKWL